MLQAEMVVNSFCYKFFGLQQGYGLCKNLYWKMESVFIYLFLPLAGLTIVWKRKELFSNFWMNVERHFLPVALHSFGRRKLILNWAKQRLPPNWSSYMDTLSGGIADFWIDGSLLCTLVNTAVPGACPNPYRHWQKTPDHAQDVAYKYLGIFPIFSETDFSSSLTPYLEKKLLDYLNLIRKSISKLEKDKLYYSFISTRYVARGMGLYTAEQFKESEFFIYSKTENSSFYNVEILILGPYSTYFRTTILECLLKDSKKSSSESKMGNSWLRAKECYLEKLRDLNDPPTNAAQSIEIKVEIQCDRVKVSYKSKNYGVHEITLNCNNEVIMGSPFYVNILKGADDSDLKEIKDVNNSVKGNLFRKMDNKQNEDSPKEHDTPIKPANNFLNEEYCQNNKNITSKTNMPKRNVHTETISLKHIAKIKNDIKEIRNYKNPSDNFTDNCITTDSQSNNFYLKKEGTLEISKYLNDLRNEPIKNIKLNVEEQDNQSLYFSKENYSCFQNAVDCSFRRSCRITRKSPGLVQKKCPVLSCASPVCSDHIVPEDLEKRTVEDKRKRFSMQQSLAIVRDSKRTSSSFSVEENRTEAPSVNENPKNVNEVSIPITNAKTSSTGEIRRDFKKFVNIDNMNRNDDESRLYRIVKEKKLFWETVFQNSSHSCTVQAIQNLTTNTNNPSTLIKRIISIGNNFKGEESRLENNKCKKLTQSHALKHVDSLCILKRRTFSKSSGDIRYIEKKRNLVTYKSMDENLDKCCNVSLDNRTRIYLDHISSFKSKSIGDPIHSIKFKRNKPNKDLEYFGTKIEIDR